VLVTLFSSWSGRPIVTPMLGKMEPPTECDRSSSLSTPSAPEATSRDAVERETRTAVDFARPWRYPAVVP
jgi:hypothetical protein